MLTLEIRSPDPRHPRTHVRSYEDLKERFQGLILLIAQVNFQEQPQNGFPFKGRHHILFCAPVKEIF